MKGKRPPCPLVAPCPVVGVLTAGQEPVLHWPLLLRLRCWEGWEDRYETLRTELIISTRSFYQTQNIRTSF